MSEQKLTRRAFLRASAVAVVGAAVSACAQTSPTPAPAAPAATAAPTKPAPAPTATQGPVKGGTYTDVSFADGVSLQPLITNDNASSNYQALIYNAYLFRRDPKTLAWIPDTAESYSFSEDGLTITIKLRKDLKWSDGKPITTADYKFTYDKMLDEKVKFPYRSNYTNNYESMTAVDDYTIAMKLKKLFCPAVDYVGSIHCLPKHVFENLDINQNDVNNKPTVVSGPFKLKEWVKDSHAIFEANDSWHRGRPNLDQYIYRIVKDNTVATAMFKTQEIDTCQPDPINWAEIKALPHTQALEYYTIGSSWTFIGFKIDHPILGDVKVRQALCYAIDKKQLIDKIRLGFARPQYSFVHAASWAYTEDLPKYEVNAQKAKDLLKEAGWAVGSDGILAKAGAKLKLRLHYNAGNTQREQICIIAQQAFKDIGVETEVFAEEWNAYLERIMTSRDFDMYCLGWTGGGDPDGQSNIWGTDRGQNFNKYSNKRVDELFAEAAVVKGCSQDERKKLYAEAQKLIAEDAGYIFLYTNQFLTAVNNRFVVNPVTALGFSYDIQKWYSKTGK
jgi:peptide/nickel transport system substrate-binding protein